MGELILPTSGTVHVETPTLIYTVERHPVYGALLDPFWYAALAGQVTPISSELMITEALVSRFGRAISFCKRPMKLLSLKLIWCFCR